MGARTRGLANNILANGTIDATDGLSGTIPASNVNNTTISSVTSLPSSVGDFIQSVASDPSPATQGDVWYNNASYAFKLAAVTTSGTFASGGSLNTARRAQIGGVGTQTTALAFGGNIPPNTPSNATESYNGTSWTNAPNLNTGRSGIGGAGTPTSALAFGGETFPGPVVGNTELYNGTSWTNNPTGLNTSRANMAGIGSVQTAALAVGGGNFITATESWNGSNWTTLPAVTNTGRYGAARAGTQTAALIFGGAIPPNNASAVSESWNGSSWTNTPSLNTARYQGGGAGTQTSAVIMGGFIPPQSAATELWDGTSWTTNPNNMGTARNGGGSTGTQADALIFGGGNPSPGWLANTEEFTGPGVAVTKTITTS